MDLSQISQESAVTLNKAKELCSTAESSLSNLLYSVIDISQRLEALDESIGQLSRFQSLLNSYISYIEKIINLYSKNVGDSVQTLETNQLKLSKIVEKLQKTPIPASLAREQHLGDFISDEIPLLLDNIAILKNNVAVTTTFLLKSIEETVSTPFSKVIEKKFQEFTRIYEDLMVENHHNNIQTIIDENEALEKELVSLLSMLTHHYDQCLQANNQNLPPHELHLLYTDSLESKTVLHDLQSIYQLIISNEVRGKKIYDALLAKIEAIYRETRKYTKQGFKFKSINMFQIIILLHKTEQLGYGKMCDEYNESLSQLTGHYVSFYDLYMEYLQEMHYEHLKFPLLFLGKVNGFLQEMEQLKATEMLRREAWVRKHGRFLPPVLQLDPPPEIVEVTSSVAASEALVGELEALVLPHGPFAPALGPL